EGVCDGRDECRVRSGRSLSIWDSAMSRSALVIGSGIVGVSSAHFLSQMGWKVTIVDRGRFAGGCSHANCGLICPSHILPLAEPGAVRRTMAAMLSKNSPF